MAAKTDGFVRMTGKVNLDLSKERETATFNPLELTNILDGGPDCTKRRKEIEHIVLSDTLFQDKDRLYMSKSQLYEQGVQKSVKLLQWRKKYQWTDDEFTTAVNTSNQDSALGLHYIMFIPAIEQLATDEQKAKWLPLALNCRILGTYAQTELGHGTNLLGLETVATFDPQTDEFILNTPHLSSMKWWPGALGKSSNHAVVLAQLEIQGKRYGMHPFIVQLRSLEDHTLLPGVTAGDVGPKMGLGTIDNGFLILKNVHIPRENMLMRNAKVTKGGQYTAVGSNKANYATMMCTRVEIVFWAFALLSHSVTIAVRYSAVRRQSQLKPGQEEQQILSYQSQQYKLFPALASVHAIFFTAQTVKNLYNKAYPKIMKGNNKLLAELHSQTSCVKALAADISTEFAEILRRSCGGHGYMKASGLPDILISVMPLVTVEGENTVLYQQTARYLMKQAANALSGQTLEGSVTYLNTEPGYICPIKIGADCRNVHTLCDMYKSRAYGIVMQTAQKLHHDMTSGQEQHIAWNNNMIRLVRAAKVHGQLYFMQCFVEGIEQSGASPELKAVLLKLCCLFALYGITNHAGDFLETETINLTQLELLRSQEHEILSEIRPNAVSLVDAFDINDIRLHSAIGCYDGNAYERLYESALKEQMNETDVHPAYYKYLQDLIKNTSMSKL